MRVSVSKCVGGCEGEGGKGRGKPVQTSRCPLPAERLNTLAQTWSTLCRRYSDRKTATIFYIYGQTGEILMLMLMLINRGGNVNFFIPILAKMGILMLVCSFQF